MNVCPCLTARMSCLPRACAADMTIRLAVKARSCVHAFAHAFGDCKFFSVTSSPLSLQPAPPSNPTKSTSGPFCRLNLARHFLPHLSARLSSKTSMVAWSQLFDDEEELGELLEGVFGPRETSAAAAAMLRRRVAAFASHQGGGQGPPGQKRRVQLFSWPDHVARLTEAQFKRRYRLTWPSFNKLLGILKADLDIVNQKQAKIELSAGHVGLFQRTTYATNDIPTCSARDN